MNRIRRLLAERDRKLLVPFFTAGYPSVAATLELVSAAIEADVDVIELGMPFSDPLADGPDIQFSSFEALKNGVSLRTIMGMVSRIRERSDVPLVLMGYYNPLLAYGEKKFMHEARQRGVDGLIIPDLPVEEALEYRNLADSKEISSIFLVSPTSSDKRIELIDRASSDFVYAVTVTGVTGGDKQFDKSTDSYLKSLRARLSRPFVAGFGVSSAASAKRLARHADGVVIGSALVRLVKDARNQKDARKRVSTFLKEIRQAI